MNLPDRQKEAQKQGYRHIFGPAPSRRLGLSLGLDLLPRKTCTLDCLYCEAGRTTLKTARRIASPGAEEILAELKAWLEDPANPEPDFITLAGSGEPSLNLGLGRVIEGARRLTPAKVAVLTNSTLLTDPAVRREMATADLVAPSLDAVDEDVFQQLNQPHPSLGLAEIVEGLVSFSQGFTGQLWLEILLVRGVNDAPAHLARLAATAQRIRAEKIQLGTVFRPPAHAQAQPLSQAEMAALLPLFGPRAELSGSFEREGGGPNPGRARDQALALIARRPVDAADLAAALGLSREQARALAKALLDDGLVEKRVHLGRDFLYPKEESTP